jgi:hypothetical protein
MLSEREEQIAATLSYQVAPALHIPDAVRLGVIASSEEHELWLQGHLMGCEGCRAPLIALLLRRTAMSVGRPPDIPCAKTRNVMFRYLEGGPEPDDATFAHISSCDLCDDLFFEPAQAVVLKEYEPEHVGEVD